jgi:hypothetical protein
MVEIIGSHRLSEFRDKNEEHAFPQDELSQIRRAIESVPEDVFLESESGREVIEFDRRVGQSLTKYSLEGSNECSLWEEEGFNHSVDLYHPEKRIAIELEKSERKYVWKDLAKFGRGAHTEVNERKKSNLGVSWYLTTIQVVQSFLGHGRCSDLWSLCSISMNS